MRAMKNGPLTFTLSRMPSPIGEMLLVTDERGRLRALDWHDYEDRMSHLMARYYRSDGAQLSEGPVPAPLARALEAYFAGQLDAIDTVEVETGGTPFQKLAWAALRQIPAGKTASYAEQAARIGRPSAMRAVGLANGANPVGLVVPCHRVIGANGSLTGYGGGLHRKRWLLEHEGVAIGGAQAQGALF
jgi:methylated-DNA-[protein]-cysteine S-methyltransferase